MLKQVKRFETDDGMKAVVIRIDSPGGSVGPSQEIHDEVKRLAAKKPVVCSLGNVAASGGFYVAVACPKIVAAAGDAHRLDRRHLPVREREGARRAVRREAWRP